MEFLVTVFYVIVCVLLFSLAIAIHEFGHFIVALKLGLRVEAFSIGFGPALWKKKVNGVEYRLSAIPLGGYVLIPDIDPEGTQAVEGGTKPSEGKPAKQKLPAWKEICVAAAGPLMNIVLAVVLALVLAAVPSAKFGRLTLNVQEVPEDGPAARAGILPGDRIVAVNGNEVWSKSDLQTELLLAGKGNESELELLRGEQRLTVRAVPDFVQVNPVSEVPMLMVVLAATENADAAAWMPDRSPWQQLKWDAGSIFRVLKGLVTPKEAKATAGALGGPVMIAEGIYRSMRRNPCDGLGFLRFLNVNLAILNLLPIPVLDGSLILFSLLALVFRRRVPDFIVKYLSLIFMVLLMGLMGLLILRDSWRSYRLHTWNPDTAEKADVHETRDAQP